MKTVGQKITTRSDLHTTHGDSYWAISGRSGIVMSVDKPDEDGEQVYGVRFGRNEWKTVTESMLK